MIRILLTYNKGYEWFSKNDIFVKGYIFTSDNQLIKDNALIDYL